MRKLINRYKEQLIAAAMFITTGLAGNLFYEDEVAQHQSNCSNAAYVFDNKLECHNDK